MAFAYFAIDFMNAFVDFLQKMGIDNPREIIHMIPYVATMVALALTSKKSRAPKASGIPFEPGAR
jgi:simple sugar transport system permease protein